MVVRYMPNSDPWGPTGIPFMIIFVFYVNPQIPNIENFDAYEDRGLTKQDRGLDRT